MLGSRRCTTRSYTRDALQRPPGPLRGRTLRVGPKKFAEPVSLSSTASADLPLAGAALRSGFVLLALRARRKQHTNACTGAVKESTTAMCANCALFFFLYRARVS